MEYYLAIKKNVVQMRTVAWMNLEKFMLDERNQLKWTIFCLILFI